MFIKSIPNNPKYGNTTKLFNKSDVRHLAYRKAATVAGMEETICTEEFLSKGRELLGTELDVEAWRAGYRAVP